MPEGQQGRTGRLKPRHTSALFDHLRAQAKLRLERARASNTGVDVGVSVATRYSADDCGSYAAALTYYVFLSIFPLLLVAASVLGYLTFGNQELKREIIDAGVDAAPLVRDALKPAGLKAIEERRQGLAVTGLLLALYSGSGAIVALEHALNRIDRIEQEGSLVAKRLRSLRWLGILGAAMVLSVGLTSLEGVLPGGELITSGLALAGAVVIDMLLFVSAFKFLPARARSVSDVLPGAVLATIAFEALKIGEGFFAAGGSDSREGTFGAFALAAGLLLGSYMLCQVILLAAELNAVLVERRETRQSPAPKARSGEGT
jgi:membrane protein